MVFSGVVNCFNIMKRYLIYYCEEKKIDRLVVGQGLFVLLLLVQKRYIFWDR